jgi:tetratricopeptide (TPR) repeat protein
MTQHRWIVAPKGGGRRRKLGSAAGIVVDAHSRRRAPYSAAGALLIALFERFGAAARLAAADRLVTLLAVEPELRGLVEVPAAVERSLEFSRAGNHRSFSLQCAHGVVDFLLDLWARSPGAPDRLVLLDVDRADPIDAELLAVLLRRLPPETAQIEMVSSSHAVPDPLGAALERYAGGQCAAGKAGSVEDLYLAGDGRDEDPAELAAAARRCMHFAYYEPALTLARRAQETAERRGERPPAGVIRDIIFALLLLEQYEEVEALADACLRQGSDPAVCVHSAYAIAILCARLRSRGNLDLERARRCIDQARHHSEALPPSQTRAANLAFLRNTLALVTMREDGVPAARQLLDEAIDYLAREAPDLFAFEATILFHNRARLHLMAGQVGEALNDLGRLLALEPSNSEALFDRGLIRQRAGRSAEALRDYDDALRWGPPQVETLANRAQLLTHIGAQERARRDYDHLLDIDPDHVEGRIGSAYLYWLQGLVSEAAAETARGLRLRPDHARLICLRGLIALGERRLDDAYSDFSLALRKDRQLADAWANRAAISWRRGALSEALDDLDRALALRADPVIRKNRDRVRDRLSRDSATGQAAAAA